VGGSGGGGGTGEAGRGEERGVRRCRDLMWVGGRGRCARLEEGGGVERGEWSSGCDANGHTPAPVGLATFTVAYSPLLATCLQPASFQPYALQLCAALHSLAALQPSGGSPNARNASMAECESRTCAGAIAAVLKCQPHVPLPPRMCRNSFRSHASTTAMPSTTSPRACRMPRMASCIPLGGLCPWPGLRRAGACRCNGLWAGWVPGMKARVRGQ
jgi:hypothetical protein